MATASTRFLLALDYELFFGSRTGGIDDCLIHPTDAIVRVLEKHGAKLCLFVDAGFLEALHRASAEHASAAQQLRTIETQLRRLGAGGHDVQLHIHPHWEDCRFDGSNWLINTERYRLQDFSAEQQRDIVGRYKHRLEAMCGQAVFAYRAGGWCMQPFDAIRSALAEHGIWLDSTVYHNGVSEDRVRWFDFSGAPGLPQWRFDTDPLQVDPQGRFVEIPISSQRMAPWFFWRMAWHKKMRPAALRTFGQGGAMQADRGYYLTRLTGFSHSPASVDGLKAGELEAALREQRRRQPDAIFNVMGHPKSLTPWSLVQLDRFLGRHREFDFVTFQDLQHLRPAG